MLRGSLVAGALLVSLSAFADADESGKKEPEVVRPRRENPLSGKFSLAFDWGASFSTQPAVGLLPGAPLYIGGTVSFWVSDWFLIDLHASHAFNNQRTAVIAGPRFRTLTYPISASIGLRAGVITEPNIGPRFALSPLLAIDMLFVRHVLAGLEGCVDVPVGGNGASVRVGLKLGWRF